MRNGSLRCALALAWLLGSAASAQLVPPIIRKAPTRLHLRVTVLRDQQAAPVASLERGAVLSQRLDLSLPDGSRLEITPVEIRGGRWLRTHLREVRGEARWEKTVRLRLEGPSSRRTGEIEAELRDPALRVHFWVEVR